MASQTEWWGKNYKKKDHWKFEWWGGEKILKNYWNFEGWEKENIETLKDGKRNYWNFEGWEKKLLKLWIMRGEMENYGSNYKFRKKG